MRLSLVAIAAIAFVESMAFAEPRKAAPAPAAEPQQKPVGIVLASADTHSPATENAAKPNPAKRSITPRVTTCRCGDPQVDPETQDQ